MVLVVWRHMHLIKTPHQLNQYDVIEQLQAGSEKFADWLNSFNGSFHEIIDNEKILTSGGRYLLCMGYLLTYISGDR